MKLALAITLFIIYAIMKVAEKRSKRKSIYPPHKLLKK